MRAALLAAVVVTACFVTTPAPALAAPRDARDVVVRGGTDLVEVLAAATRTAWSDPGDKRPVAIVVDVTPNTMAAGGRLAAAFERLGDEIRHLSGSWRLGALGRPLGDPVRHPSALAIQVPRVLADETPESNTFRSLGRTLGAFKESGGLVVYLADWRFEDDYGLEEFIGKLRGRGQTITVIGSEGCFGRPWTDAFHPVGPRAPGENYEESIGRSPFENRDPSAPWHGGDTAFPHLPWIFGEVPWRTEFRLDYGELADQARSFDPVDPEDLEVRLDESIAEKAVAYAYPLPSSFGPYGLMRAAAETGGTYRLFSFNPKGRTDLKYDYSRCNLFPPDLRSRPEILADAARQPLVAATLRAWEILSGRQCGMVRITPPIEPRRGGPKEMEFSAAQGCCFTMWQTKSEWRKFLKDSTRKVEILDEAVRVLSTALKSPRPRSGPEARYRADAEMFLHAAQVLRFEMAEAHAAAEDVPPRAWDVPDVYPGLEYLEWLPAGDEAEEIEPAADVDPFDRDGGRRLIEARRDHLRLYRETPFGETVRRNSIYTYRLTNYFLVSPGGADRTSRTPSESDRDGDETPVPDRRPTPRPAGSSGGGPASGK